MQQFFRLLIFLIQSLMFLATNSTILRSTFSLYIPILYDSPTLLQTGWQKCRWIVPKGVYSRKVLLRMGEFVARNMLGLIKKINKRKSCCNLLVIYIIVLKWCTATQTSWDFLYFTYNNLWLILIFLYSTEIRIIPHILGMQQTGTVLDISNFTSQTVR